MSLTDRILPEIDADRDTAPLHADEVFGAHEGGKLGTGLTAPLISKMAAPTSATTSAR